MFQNQKGLSMVSVLMASAMMGALALIVVRTLEMGDKGVKRIEQNSAILSETNLISQIVGDTTNCSATLVGQNLAEGSVAAIKTPSGDKYVIGQKIGKLTLSDMKKTAFTETSAGSGLYEGKLKLTFTTGGSVPTTKTKDIPLLAKVDASNNIATCYSSLSEDGAAVAACDAFNGTIQLDALTGKNLCFVGGMPLYKRLCKSAAQSAGVGPKTVNCPADAPGCIAFPAVAACENVLFYPFEYFEGSGDKYIINAGTSGVSGCGITQKQEYINAGGGPAQSYSCNIDQSANAEVATACSQLCFAPQPFINNNTCSVRNGNAGAVETCADCAGLMNPLPQRCNACLYFHAPSFGTGCAVPVTTGGAGGSM